MIRISDANPIQFWINGVISFNNKEEAGVNHVCFEQPFNCTDDIKIQVKDDAGKTLFISITDSDNVELQTLGFSEVSTGVYQLTFKPSSLNICQKVKIKIKDGSFGAPQIGSIADLIWNKNVFGNGVFVAVASSGTGQRAATSADGLTWTLRNTPANNNWSSVAFGNGLFVAVSTDGTNRVMTSPDGITWTARNCPASSWFAVTYGGGKFVAVSLAGAAMYSTDGITWTLGTAPTETWYSVTYGAGKFVSIANNGATMYSADGITWTGGYEDNDGIWNDITYGNGLFVIVGERLTAGVALYSTDGINFTRVNTPNNRKFRSVAFGANHFIAVTNISGQGEFYQRSTDGVIWVESNNLNDRGWTSVCFGNNRFSCVGPDSFVTQKASIIPFTVGAELAYTDTIYFAESHAKTRLIEYTNPIDYAGLVYEGVSPMPVFGIRVKSKFYEQRFPEENESEPDGGGNVDKLSSETRVQRLLEIDPLPPHMHKKLKLALQHGTITIDGEQWVKEEAYETEPVAPKNPFFKGKVWLTLKDGNHFINVT